MTRGSDDAPCPEAFVDLARRLADRAREITGRYFRRPVDIEHKADHSPVTVADRETEAALRAMIAEAFPDHGVVGEEQGAHLPDARFLWVIDPIDGTKRFITGHVQFGTLIALLDAGRPILGIIDMPQLDERWLGAAGRPSVHHDRRGVRPARTRICPEVAAATLYSTSPQMFEGADLAAFERLRAAVKTPLFGGECYSYGLLASGFNDLVVEADMSPYDYLAQVAVIDGAGGIITDWQGRPLGLESDGRVLAAGDPALHRTALDLLARA